MVFERRTNEGGIINAIDAINGFDFVVPTIIIGEGRIKISSEEKIYTINDILLLEAVPKPQFLEQLP
jgi:hypothetical protein